PRCRSLPLSTPPRLYIYPTSPRSPLHLVLFSVIRRPPTPTLFPYTTLFRSAPVGDVRVGADDRPHLACSALTASTRNSTISVSFAMAAVWDSDSRRSSSTFECSPDEIAQC